MPIVSAVWSRGYRHIFFFIAAEVSFNRSACRRINTTSPVHVRIWLCGNQFASESIQYVEETILWCLHDDLPFLPIKLHVGKDKLLCCRIVPMISRGGLIMPYILTVVWVQCYY